jgi:hypothetical protein
MVGRRVVVSNMTVPLPSEACQDGALSRAGGGVKGCGRNCVCPREI